MKTSIPIATVILTLLVGPCATGSWAQSSSREAELEAIRDQIMVLQGRLNRVRQEATGLRGDLEQTRVALELQQIRLAEAETARHLAEESLAEVANEIEGLEERLEDLRLSLRR